MTVPQLHHLIQFVLKRDNSRYSEVNVFASHQHLSSLMINISWSSPPQPPFIGSMHCSSSNFYFQQNTTIKQDKKFMTNIKYINSSWPSDAILWRQHIVQELYIFHYERIPPNLRCCNFFKVDIIIFENPLQKLRNFTFWHFPGGGEGGGHFGEKKY